MKNKETLFDTIAELCKSRENVLEFGRRGVFTPSEVKWFLHDIDFDLIQACEEVVSAK